MHTIWRSLLWREWHEHKWKLASLTTILVSLEIASIWGEPVLAIIGGPLFAIVPLAVFIAMGSAAGERTQGTLPFARSLPVKRWEIAVAKLAAGGLTLLASVVFALLLPLAWVAALEWKGHVIGDGPFKGVGPFETIFYAGVLAAGLAMSCFAWCVAVGVNRATEIRAGLSGAALLLVAVLFRTLDEKFRTSPDPTLAIRLGWCNEIGPLGFTLLFDPLASPWRVVFSQLAVCAVLCAWSIHQYGRAEAIERRTSETGESFSGNKRGSQLKAIRPAWRTAAAAIAWKQAREAAPFCLVGIVLVLGFWFWMLSIQREFAEALSAAGITVAMLAGLLVGIGTFIGELQPRMMDFWRSRPIEPAFWFWTKYFTGLAAASLFLATPIAASGREGFFMTLVFLPWLAIIYSLAVCLTCLVRHSFYAGVLSFTLALFLFVLSAAHSREWLNVASYLVVLHRARDLAPGDWLISVYAPYLAITTFSAASIAFAAWVAIKRDVGSHSISRIGRALRPG